MKGRPILFNGEMVRALLAGTKTQTRRIVKPQPFASGYYEGTVDFDGFRIPREGGLAPAKFSTKAVGGGAYMNEEIYCPYGQPGDRLWVRETFGYVSPDENQCLIEECNIEYRADLHPKNDDAPGGWPKEEVAGLPNYPRWRPSIHMPRAASRILLEIVSVRVERLNDISEPDARAEGITDGGCVCCGNPEPCCCPTPSPDARDAFVWLWESINGAGSWAANPWVWVAEFKRVTP